MNDHRPRLVWRRVGQAGLVGVVAMVALVVLMLLGYISRAKARALSPDGRVEQSAVGWLPEATEYGIWLRRRWQPWGTQSGSESMGCESRQWPAASASARCSTRDTRSREPSSATHLTA